MTKTTKERVRKPKKAIEPTWPRTDDQWRQSRPVTFLRPLRFLREKLTIGRDPKTGARVMHPAMKAAERAAKAGDGRTLQLLAQRVNVLGIGGLK